MTSAKRGAGLAPVAGRSAGLRVSSPMARGFRRGLRHVKWMVQFREPVLHSGATRRVRGGTTRMATAVIVSATRTAIGTLGGALAQIPATRLGAIAVREAIRRAKLEPGQV